MVNGPGNLPERVPAPPVTPPPRPASARPEFKPAEKPELSQAPDQVSISPRARETANVASKAKAVPEVRPDRVEQARQSLGRNASAPAGSAKIAEKLLTES